MPKLRHVLPLLLLIAAIIGSHFLQFRLPTRSIERVSLLLKDVHQSSHPLDQLLLNHYQDFRRSPALEQLLQTASREIVLDKGFVSRCQVSQKDFGSFSQWLRLQPEQWRFRHPDTPAEWSFSSHFREHRVLGRLESPASGVGFYDAIAYCRASGGRLPSADEWTAIASGKEGRLYPWGDEFIARPWRFRNPLLNAASSCGLYPETDTPQGVADMGSGLSEWTTSDSPQGRPLLKGGNAFSRPYQLHALNLLEREAPANFRSQFAGFRCLYPPQKAAQRNAKQYHIKMPWGGYSAVIPVAAETLSLALPAQARLPVLLKDIQQEDDNQHGETLRILLQSSAAGDKAQKITVSRYEISVSQYRSFLRDPLVRLGFYANEKEPKDHSYIPLKWPQQLTKPAQPVVGISWWDAYAFAYWAGGRLPTEEQWVRLFGGHKRQVYPWGDHYQGTLAAVRKTGQAGAALPVHKNRDKNDFGVAGMAGNVSEWTSSAVLTQKGYQMIIKGGNFLLPGKESAHVGYIARAPADHRSAAIGMRIIFDNRD